MGLERSCLFILVALSVPSSGREKRCAAVCRGQAVCHHPGAVSYPSLRDLVTIHITVSHCFFKAHYWQGLVARHRSGVVLSMLNRAINVCHH